MAALNSVAARAPFVSPDPIDVVLRETLNGHGICGLEYCCCDAMDNILTVE